MLKIYRSPDPVLRQVCEPFDLGDTSIPKLAKQMAKAMYKYNGVGLAAPQVGVTKQLIVVDVDWDPDNPATQDPLVLVNPQLIETWGTPETDNEGCLSCPGINVPVTRSPWARVRYWDVDGEAWEIEGDGLLGRCLQHEIDHLNGRTLFESCDPDVKIDALLVYDEAIAAGAKPGDTSFQVAKPIKPRVKSAVQ